MLSASSNPLSLDSFFMLRLVTRAARSSIPTWSTLGESEKLGIFMVEDSASIFTIYEIQTY